MRLGFVEVRCKMAKADEIAARIETVRTTMRTMYGDRWPEISAPYREMLEGAMRGSGETNVLRVVLPLAQELDRRGRSPLVLLATAGDMAAGSPRPLDWPCGRCGGKGEVCDDTGAI